jgi:outer membrane immunogenic protein
VPTAALANLYDADMSVPAYKALPPPLAYYNWTGFYVGGNIGYSVGNDRIGQTLAIPGVVSDANFADAVVAPKGVLGGVQLGYNWQGGRNWLTGIEFDFQGASQQDKACGLSCEMGSGPGTTIQQTLNVEQKLQYFGTARARLGVVDDNVLFYVTGGGAYGRVNETTNTIFNVGPPIPATFASSQITDNRFGWVAGAGIEAALWGNWTAKAEYLYMDLGNLAANTSAVGVPGLGGAPTPAIQTTTSSIRDNIVRAGVNYRFGPEMPGPEGGLYNSAAAAPYPPTYHWSGFYVGGNLGYAQGDNRISQTAVSTVPPFFAGASDNSVITPKGVAGGLQLGYNWQGGANWLAGFEADIQGTNQSDTACTPIICFSQTAAGGGGTDALTAKQTLDYFATVRGRLGLVNNNILYYGTGGVALGHVNETVAVNFTLSAPSAFDTSNTSADLIGWVIGGGIEAAVWGNWTAKAEYLYMDLGTISNTLAVTSQNTTFTTSSTVKDHIFRAGVNYHL